MTVTEIVNDLLNFNMITIEAATVLLQTELKANMLDSQVKNTNQEFQPYHRFQNMGTTNPYYVSTTTNDPIKGTSTELSAGAKELLNLK